MNESYMAISLSDWAIGRDPIEALESLIYIGKTVPNKYVLYHIAGDNSPMLSSNFKILHKVGAKATLVAKYQNDPQQGFVEVQ